MVVWSSAITNNNTSEPFTANIMRQDYLAERVSFDKWRKTNYTFGRLIEETIIVDFVFNGNKENCDEKMKLAMR